MRGDDPDVLLVLASDRPRNFTLPDTCDVADFHRGARRGWDQRGGQFLHASLARALGFDLADADSDAVLTHSELRDHAQSEAMDKMSDADAEILQGFMMFDLDGDGLVTMKEVVSGVRAMVERA